MTSSKISRLPTLARQLPESLQETRLRGDEAAIDSDGLQDDRRRVRTLRLDDRVQRLAGRSMARPATSSSAPGEMPAVPGHHGGLLRGAPTGRGQNPVLAKAPSSQP